MDEVITGIHEVQSYGHDPFQFDRMIPGIFHPHGPGDDVLLLKYAVAEDCGHPGYLVLKPDLQGLYRIVFTGMQGRHSVDLVFSIIDLMF